MPVILKLATGMRNFGTGVMPMKAEKGAMVGFEVGDSDAASPILAIVGPLIGLAYIVLLPLAGVAVFILASGYRATQSLASMWRRVTQATVDTPERARAETIDLRDFLQPLIDGLECEFVVVDRELRITQYHTPLLRQNKLLEQTAIGKHCFEVSHERNSPCESCEYECPVKKVLETNEKVTVTHYHQNQLEGKGRQRLVKVLASPIRDSQGSVTQVAELIWDADNVKEIVLSVGKRR